MSQTPQHSVLTDRDLGPEICPAILLHVDNDGFKLRWDLRRSLIAGEEEGLYNTGEEWFD